MIKLEDKLYTSTEVADILGVSLRSVYRYIEENKLVPEVRTATGRHRFTKQNIIDFLYPEGSEARKDELSELAKQVKSKKVVEAEVVEETPEVKLPIKKVAKAEEEVAEPLPEEKKEVVEAVEPAEPVDWLSKFREAAKKFEEEPVREAPAPKEEAPAAPTVKEKFSRLVEEEERQPEVSTLHYRSRLGGLKDIAQNIDKASKNSGLDYAFTMNAGLSLHSPIKPFSLLHVYVRSKDKEFFERILMLTPSDEENAQLCMVPSDDNKIYNASVAMHGLTVVAKDRLLNDIREMDTEGALTKEAESILG